MAFAHPHRLQPSGHVLQPPKSEMSCACCCLFADDLFNFVPFIPRLNSFLCPSSAKRAKEPKKKAIITWQIYGNWIRQGEEWTSTHETKKKQQRARKMLHLLSESAKSGQNQQRCNCCLGGFFFQFSVKNFLLLELSASLSLFFRASCSSLPFMLSFRQWNLIHLIFHLRIFIIFFVFIIRRSLFTTKLMFSEPQPSRELVMSSSEALIWFCFEL